MTRYLLTAAVLVSLAATAPAQFLGRQAYGYNYSPFGTGGYGFSYGGMNWTYFQTREFTYAYNNPFLGYSGVVNLNFSYAGAIPPGGYGTAVNPYAQSAYMYGGAGGYSAYNPGANPIIQEQQRLLAGGRADNGRRGGDANRMIAEQAAVEFGRAAPRPVAAAPAGLDPMLIEPTDAAVLSGEALNALQSALRPILERRKGEPPVFPAEVLARVRFGGPAAAELVSLARAGKVQFPSPLDRPEFERLRADLEKPSAELVTAMADGRRSDPPAADRLAFGLKKARSEHAAALRNLGVTDAMDASRFLSALDRLAEAGRDGGLTGFYPAKWATGATAAELLVQMDRLKLTFGPAGPGDDDAYFAIHRGLLNYYLSLSTPRR